MASTGLTTLRALLDRLLPKRPADRDDAAEEEDESAEASEEATLDELVTEVSQVGVTNLVEALGPFLTTEDPLPRVKSTAVLSEVLKKLPDEEMFMNNSQAQTLVSFFVNRYETDWESALACLRGIQVLLARKSVNKQTLMGGEFARVLTSKLLTAHKVNELSLTLRKLIFDLMKLMVTDYKAFLSQTDEDPWLSSAFAVAMTGEKDPRCLLVCLDIIRVLLKEKSLGGELFVEDAFEVTSVYFPITFRPPPDDPVGITHDQLVDSLNSVFCAIPSMANCVLPMVLEKLKMTSTEAAQARVEALKLITRCARDFDALTLANFLPDLRDTLVGLILSPDEAELAVEALVSLKALVRLVAPRGEIDPQDVLWEQFTIVTLRRCGMALEASFDSMAASGAAKILIAISESCSTGFKTTLQGASQLLETYFTRTSEQSTSKTVAAVDLIRNLARCVDPQVGHLAGQGPMDPFAEKLFGLVANQLVTVTTDQTWLGSSENSRLVISCCLALKELVVRPVHLTVSQDLNMKVAAHILNGVLRPTIQSKHRSLRVDVIGSAVLALLDMDSKDVSHSIMSTLVVPAIVKDASDTLSSDQFDFVGGDPKEIIETILSIMPIMAKVKSAAVAKSVVTFVNSLDQLPPSATMSVLAKIAKNIDDTKVMEECFLSPPETIEVWMNAEDSRELIFILCERCSPDINKTIATRAVYRLSNTDSIDTGTEAGILAMRRDYDFVLPVILSLLRANNSIVDDEAFLRVFACSLNKAPASSVSDPESMQQLYESVDGITAVQTAKLMGRAFKALTLRSSMQPSERLGRFLQSLLHSDEEAVALEAAMAFGNLMLIKGVNDGLDVPFARSQGVARQRAFEKWFKVLNEDLGSLSKRDEAVLSACAALAAGAPHAVLMESLNEVVLIMVRASKSPHIDARLSALRILKTIMQEAIDAVENHLSTLIPYLLRFTAGPSRAPEPEDRLDALTVLQMLPEHLPYHKLHPYRSIVSNSLAKGALDDSKRAVRQKAVECREKWALFSSS